MKALSETVEIQAPAPEVFAHIDDIRNVGWHMTEQASMATMGSKLTVVVLSEQRTGLGATYRYSGKIMGLALDFSELPVVCRVPTSSGSSACRRSGTLWSPRGEVRNT